MENGKAIRINGEVTRAFASSLLVVLLVFNAIAPIPIGVKAVDEFRMQKADAIAPAAVAAIAVFGSVIALGGIYVCANNSDDYGANLQQVYNYYTSYSGVSSEEFNGMLLGAVDSDGNIDMSMLPASLLSDLPDFSNYLAAHNYAVRAGNSLGMVNCVVLNGLHFKKWSGVPTTVSLAASSLGALSNDGYSVMVGFASNYYDSGVSYSGKSYRNVDTFYLHQSSETGYWLSLYSAYSRVNDCKQVSVYSNPVSGGSSYDVRQLSGFSSFTIYAQEHMSSSWVGNYLNPDLTYTSGKAVSSGSYQGGSTAVVDSGVSVPTSGTYQVFEPTAEQLSSGYDSTSVLQAEVAEQGMTIAELQERIKAQAADLVNVMARLDESDEKVGDLQGQVTANAAAISATQGSVNELNNKFDAKTASLAMLIDQVKRKAEENADEITAMKASESSMEQRLTALETQSEANKADLGTVIDIERQILTALNPLNGDLTHDGKTIAAIVAGMVNPLSGVKTAAEAISRTLDTVKENEEEYQGTLLGDLANFKSMVDSKIDTLKNGLTKQLEDILKALGDTALGGLIKQILGMLQKVIEGDFSLAKILEAILAIPQAAADALAGTLEAIFIPSPNHIQLKVDEVKVALKDKLGWDYDVNFSFNEKEPGKIDAPVHAGILNIDSITMFDPKFLKSAVDAFRGILRGFVAMLLLFFSYNQLMAILGGRQLFTVGKAMTDEGAKGGK